MRYLLGMMPMLVTGLFTVLATTSAWADGHDELGELPLPGPAPAPPVAGDYELLMLGNSHSAANGLPDLLSAMLRTGAPQQQASAELAPGWRFLADRLQDGETQPLLQSRSWSHVILQAQKYSSSGLYFYPTAGAEEWIRRARAQNAEPILFPEWPRRGNQEEGQRVHNLHVGIASREPACVAPVGLAWEAALAAYPGVELHAPDGNHSNLNGALLTAYVLYQVISGSPADQLPTLEGLGVSADLQAKFRSTAGAAVDEHAVNCPQAESKALAAPDMVIPTLSPWALVVLAASLSMAAWSARRS